MNLINKSGQAILVTISFWIRCFKCDENFNSTYHRFQTFYLGIFNVRAVFTGIYQLFCSLTIHFILEIYLNITKIGLESNYTWKSLLVLMGMLAFANISPCAPCNTQISFWFKAVFMKTSRRDVVLEGRIKENSTHRMMCS